MARWLAVLLAVAMMYVAETSAQESNPVSEVAKVSGVEPETGTDYILISTRGRVQGGGTARLIAQCAKTKSGKSTFQLMADEPGVSKAEALTFQAPWRPGRGELFPPPLEKVTVTMEFVGYVKVKPMRRQWEHPFGSAGLIRYGTPGMSSSNMEDAASYLRYLRSLPTLRLTVPGKGVEEFETTRWQAAVRSEPLCGQSSL